MNDPDNIRMAAKLAQDVNNKIDDGKKNKWIIENEGRSDLLCLLRNYFFKNSYLSFLYSFSF